MPDQFSHSLQIRKPAATSQGGIVAAQSRRAAEIGASVLAAGGDCVDEESFTVNGGMTEPMLKIWLTALGRA